MTKKYYLSFLMTLSFISSLYAMEAEKDMQHEKNDASQKQSPFLLAVTEQDRVCRIYEFSSKKEADRFMKTKSKKKINNEVHS